MDIVLIVAVAENGVIGSEGGIPWHLSEDLRRFKGLTMGHPILMGRKTWESLGRPLPGRENVVITRQPDYDAPGATVVHSLDAALDRARAAGAQTAFVIGGGEIYRQALPLADRVELTRVHTRVEGDTTFPELDEKAWREVAREAHEQQAKDGQPRLVYEYVTYERRP